MRSFTLPIDVLEVNDFLTEFEKEYRNIENSLDNNNKVNNYSFDIKKMNIKQKYVDELNILENIVKQKGTLEKITNEEMKKEFSKLNIKVSEKNDYKKVKKVKVYLEDGWFESFKKFYILKKDNKKFFCKEEYILSWTYKSDIKDNFNKIKERISNYEKNKSLFPKPTEIVLFPDNKFWMISEYIEGKKLTDVIKKTKKQSDKEKLYNFCLSKLKFLNGNIYNNINDIIITKDSLKLANYKDYSKNNKKTLERELRRKIFDYGEKNVITIVLYQMIKNKKILFK